MDQQLALQLMKSGKNVLLTGQAGSGKTYVLRQYIQRCREQELPLAVTASTGIAATHLGWSTIHSRSGLGIGSGLSEEEVDDISHMPRVINKVRNTKVLIIDEISMLSATQLDDVQRIVQAITYADRPWWGMQVIFCGDFFQLPPVTRSSDSGRSFAFFAQAWKDADLTFCYLQTQWRQSDQVFGEILNALRVGEVTQEMLELLESRTDADLGSRSAVRLYTHNADVDRINAQELATLDTDSHTYTAETKWKKSAIASMLKGMITPEVLELKVWAKVLFTKNNPGVGYHNGTMWEVIKIDKASGYPRVRTYDDLEIVVQPEERLLTQDEDIVASVAQLPLKLARAITVHKSQGMTLDAAQIDLSKSFAHGQSYVALSRLRSLDGLSLLWLSREWLVTHNLVRRADTYFQSQSAELVEQYSPLEEADREQLHTAFVWHIRPKLQKFSPSSVEFDPDVIGFEGDM